MVNCWVNNQLAEHVTIILRARVGYEMIDHIIRAIIISYPISVHECNNCFILKNNQEILLDLADFVLQEQPEDFHNGHYFSRTSSGSYTMASKPIKSL